jgi:beta-alanine degradation protein BauB
MTPKWTRVWATANMTAVAVAALVIAGTVAATAVQTPQVTRREPQFENEHVRAWKSIIMPNQPLALHRHEFGRTIVALKGGTLDVVNEKGETIKKMTWETGRAYWLDADPPGELHGDMNYGTEPIEVIVVERQP